eukprot:scaffold24638_cov48-Cyclotella_meneghiniana.AAC.3
MANNYGFDFLRAEHNLPNQGGTALSTPPRPTAPPSDTNSNIGNTNNNNKSNLEKQADILLFLRHHRSSGCLPPSIIRKSLGIDLTSDPVAELLQNNPKIIVEEVPDPENPTLTVLYYGYKAKFGGVKDRSTLVGQINRSRYGVRWNDLLDAYDGVEKDLAEIIKSGEVLGVENPEEKDKILFPRGDSYLVELDGIVTQKNLPQLPDMTPTTDPIERSKIKSLLAQRRVASRLITTDVDPTNQIRRGEAIRVGGEWFRVSSSIREDLPPDRQPPRALAPLSVVSVKDLSKKNEVDGYTRKFDTTTIPLDGSLSEAVGIQNLEEAKRAREKLHSIASGGDASGGALRNVAGGPCSVLLSSFASEKNPALLAGAFAKSVTSGVRGAAGSIMPGGRKRPTAMAKRVDNGSTNDKSIAASNADTAKRSMEAKQAASNPSLSYSHAIRHGCTKDVRDMWLKTRELIPTSEVDLHKALLQHKLIESGEKMTRPKMKRKADTDNDGKPKKRRYYERKSMRRTNMHLDGTEIGAMLARAAEKQNQGKSVGDGGM